MEEMEALARRLRQEAQAANERRLLVLHGNRAACYEATKCALDSADIPPQRTLLVGPKPIRELDVDRVERERSQQVLGTTEDCVILDAHEAFDPDALGRTVGAVDGGGFYILLTPPLEDWPRRRGGFDRRLAVPPFTIQDVAGHFRARVLELLGAREGIAIVDVDEGKIEREGLHEPSPDEDIGEPAEPIEQPERRVFPADVYEACWTQDQADTVHALEGLLDAGQILVVEADRGRGKSSAAGLAAGALLEREADVLLTAPRRSNVDEVFQRAHEVAKASSLSPRLTDQGSRLEAAGGRLRYRPPPEALEHVGEADAVVVDEAAGLPVHLLERVLEGRTPLAFTTTIHGYEGAGRGFSVRLHDRLEETQRPVHRLRMEEPIRYAREDPLEAFSFEALLLDAAPAEAASLPEAEAREATYRQPSAEELVADEALLREAFGLLVLAHYRTRPSDLARLLDAPNVSLHCLTLEDHVVSVALVAREGGLPETLRERMYEGERVPGNLIPDVLTSQLRDEEAGRAVGWRILRIATHPARRREGFASRLASRIREEAEVDWLGTSYGATPELLSFWEKLGYRTVHLSARRNATSGEHSALQLSPTSGPGTELTDRTEAWFLSRVPSVLADALDDLDPDVVRRALAGLEQAPAVDLADRDWRLVAAAAYGSGVYDVAPRPFRRLAMRHLVEGEAELEPRHERLLVAKVLQAREWDTVAHQLDFASKRTAMRALGEAYQPLVDLYGNEAAREEAQRFG